MKRVVVLSFEARRLEFVDARDQLRDVDAMTRVVASDDGAEDCLR